MQFLLDNMTVILSLIGTGVFAGLLAGLLGVGGGIVIVPVLFFLFQAKLVFPHRIVFLIGLGSFLNCTDLKVC